METHARVCHIVRPNHRTAAVHHLITLDTEATRTPVSATAEHQTLRLGVARYDRAARKGHRAQQDYCEFTDAATCWAWVVAKCPSHSRVLVIAHNAGYDVQLLQPWEHLPRLGFARETAILESSCLLIRYRQRVNGKVLRTIEILSTTNLVGAPLGQLVAPLGRKKLRMPRDDAPLDVWFSYCRNDVDILATWFIRYVGWLREHDLGLLSPTAASQAWHAFRHRFMDVSLYVHASASALRMERSGYHGGRFECLAIGAFSGEPFYHVDVNSLYAHMMCVTDVPIKLLGETALCDAQSLAARLEHSCVMADVGLETDLPAFPKRSNGRLLFPIGRFRTTLATPELRLAVQCGALRHVYRYAWYEPAKALRTWAHAMFELRMAERHAGNRVGEAIAKLLLNSLSGKFGQLQTYWEFRAACPEWQCEQYTIQDADAGQRRTFRRFGGYVEERLRRGETSESMPGIAAHITSAGRVRMWELMQRAGRAHVYYVGQDSLILDGIGYANLTAELDREALGRLKLVRVARSLDLRASSDYSHGSQITRKAVKRSAKWHSEDTYTQDVFRTLPWAMAHKEVGHVTVEHITRQYRPTYLKGIIGTDGRVSPICRDDAL